MNIAIITIGDELLIGQVVDTNSIWIGKLLNDNGFMVVHKATIGDKERDIISAIDAAKEKAPIVLVTGGLGPTKDDITMKTISRYYGCKLFFSDKVYKNIERIFLQSGRTINELTRNQAFVPDGCIIIQNQAGTAPCTWYDRDDHLLVSMPGVPSEMKWLMTNEILPRLIQRFQQDLYIRHRTFWVNHFSESALAIRLNDFENNLPSFVKLAYLPQLGLMRIRLSAYAASEKETVDSIAGLSKELEDLLDTHILAGEDKNPEVLVGEKLRALGQTIGTAESCTGGAIAALLTSIAGSSDYFMGSIVAYDNAVKQRVLGVSENNLMQYGAVSQQVVEQMAQGALRVLGCDWAIATSGIAGPGGGTPEKPVGTIWIAIANRNKTISKPFSFNTTREQNIQRAVNMSLANLLDALKV
ncbi:MAG: CinA family nicotinamide mononucleotide deamidase-related protein [Tannerella sp.]|jgi:nicotinamide-nucleotide amidase|nr:CinA family nicotinamide mononucleotide deamidase-related protein [Tannerella sp.]